LTTIVDFGIEKLPAEATTTSTGWKGCSTKLTFSLVVYQALQVNPFQQQQPLKGSAADPSTENNTTLF